MRDYTFVQKLNAIEEIVNIALCGTVKVITHTICLIILGIHYIYKLTKQWFDEQHEPIKGAKQLAMHLQQLPDDESANVEEVYDYETMDPWDIALQNMENEFAELESKIQTCAKRHDLELQFNKEPLLLCGDYYDAPKRGRCRKGYRRVGNVCMLK